MSYRVPVLGQFAWQPPVTSRTVIDPTTLTPTKGDRFIVGPEATDDWLNKDNQIAWFDGDVWSFDPPADGWRVYDQDTNEFLTYDSGVWNSGATFSKITLTNGGPGEPAAEINSIQDDVDWNLRDDSPTSLTLITYSGINMLNFDTSDGEEKLTTVANVGIGGDLNVDGGDINVSAADTTLTINDNAAAFKIADGAADLLTINALTDLITANADLIVTGDFTVQGTTTTISSEQLTVEDPIITLNQGAGSLAAITAAGGAGLEIYDTTTVIGYLKTSATADTWKLNAGDGNELVIDINDNKTLTVAGDLNIEANSKIDQDLTKDSQMAEFAKLTLSAVTSLDFSNATANISVVDNQAAALTMGVDLLKLDTTDGAEKVDIKKLNVVGAAAIGSTLGVTGAATLQSTLGVTGSITAAGASLNFTNEAGVNVGLVQELADAFNLGGLLVVDSVDDQIEIAKLDIGGTLSVTAGATFLSTVQVTTSGITDGTETVTVSQAKQAFDQRAQYDATLHCIVFPTNIDTVVE